MKPSERIEQIFLAEVEAWKKPRHEFSRMMFGEDAPSPSGEIAFALRARALILYLDEQHNAAEQAKEFQVPIGVTEHGDKVYGI